MITFSYYIKVIHRSSRQLNGYAWDGYSALTQGDDSFTEIVSQKYHLFLLKFDVRGKHLYQSNWNMLILKERGVLPTEVEAIYRYQWEQVEFKI